MKENTTPSPTHAPGSIREMIAIAFPMVVSFSCDTLMIFTDRIFLSRLGPEHMTAAMGGGLSSFTIISFFMGLIGYSTALTAQYLGSGQKDRCARTLTQAALVALAAYPLVLLASPLMHLFFAAMGLSAGQLALQNQYFDILVLGSVVSLLRHALSSFFSGIGRTRVVMLASVITLCINALVSWILIFGLAGCPALGMTGAAIGMITGSLSGVVILALAYTHPDNAREFQIPSAWRFDPDIMKRFLKFGYPAGLEMFLTLIAFTLVVFIFQSQSLVAATATTILFNWDLVTFVPLMGIEVGVTSLVGRYMGAHQPQIAEKAVASGLKIGLGYSVLLLVPFVFFPRQMAHIFAPSIPSEIFNQAIPVAEFLLRMVAVYITAAVVLIVYAGALRGAGDTFWAMAFSVTLNWTLVPIVLLMLRHAHASIQSAWTVFVFVFLVFCALPYLRYRKGRWKSIRVIEETA